MHYLKPCIWGYVRSPGIPGDGKHKAFAALVGQLHGREKGLTQVARLCNPPDGVEDADQPLNEPNLHVEVAVNREVSIGDQKLLTQAVLVTVIGCSYGHCQRLVSPEGIRVAGGVVFRRDGDFSVDYACVSTHGGPLVREVRYIARDIRLYYYNDTIYALKSQYLWSPPPPIHNLL